MAWNLSRLQENDSDFYDVVWVANDASSGILLMGFLVGLFIIQVVLLSRQKTGVLGSFALSGWACFLYSIFFTMGGLINFYFMIGFLSVSSFATLAIYLQNNK